MQPQPQRTPRFDRLNDPPPMRLTDRDQAIVETVARLRFATSAQIIVLMPGSAQQILRRLQLLFQNGYLDRPKAQIAQLAIDGNQPMVYGLGRAGARLVADLHGGSPDRFDWHTKNARPGALFVRHTVMTSDVIVAFETALRDRPGHHLLDHEALLPYMPEATRTARNPFLWPAEIKIGGRTEKIGLVPDRLMSIVLPNRTRLNFAIEVDTGEMPVERRSMKGTSIARKIAGYHAGFKTRLHVERYGFERIRILFVTTSDKRRDSMVRATASITNGELPGLFLFATRDALLQHGALAEIWVSIGGQSQCIGL